jgi:hypothetical protein
MVLPMLSTLSVGYTTTFGSCPPTAAVCQQKHQPALSIRGREYPTLQDPVRAPPRGVAATEPIPADPT